MQQKLWDWGLIEPTVPGYFANSQSRYFLLHFPHFQTMKVHYLQLRIPERC